MVMNHIHYRNTLHAIPNGWHLYIEVRSKDMKYTNKTKEQHKMQRNIDIQWQKTCLERSRLEDIYYIRLSFWYSFCIVVAHLLYLCCRLFFQGISGAAGIGCLTTSLRITKLLPHACNMLINVTGASWEGGT